MSKDKENKPSSAKKKVAQIFQGKSPSDPYGETSMFDYVTFRWVHPIFDYLAADQNNQLVMEQIGDLS